MQYSKMGFQTVFESKILPSSAISVPFIERSSISRRYERSNVPWYYIGHQVMPQYRKQRKRMTINQIESLSRISKTSRISYSGLNNSQYLSRYQVRKRTPSSYGSKIAAYTRSKSMRVKPAVKERGRPPKSINPNGSRSCASKPSLVPASIVNANNEAKNVGWHIGASSYQRSSCNGRFL